MPTENESNGSPSLADEARAGQAAGAGKIRPKIGWDPKSALPGGTSPRVSTWMRFTHSLSAKLISLLVAGMVLIFALLGYSNIRLHRQDLEAATLLSAERVSDVIKRATEYHMMRNDRDALYQNIATMASEPGIVRIRIYDKEGTVRYSSDATEIDRSVDKSAEECYACHAQSQPLARLNRPDRFRIFRENGAGRVLAVITPIENAPRCSNAECHAHPASQRILGVLDTHMSLARADAAQAASTRQMGIYTFLAVLVIAVVCALFVMRVVGRPIVALKRGTEELTQGDLGYQIHVDSNDELGELAESFNVMSLRLRAAHEEITSWARTLENRVEEKSKELQRAHDQVVHVEKMASIGKMAAVLAHEINNPLSGILTYSKLLKKWIQKVNADDEKRKEIGDCLSLIESESKRCGELVKNMLTFSRSSPMNLAMTDINQIVERCVRLVQHQMEIASVQLQCELADSVPIMHCDPAQIEQVLLALVMNALDAMPHGGNLLLRTRSLPQSRQVELQVRDDGMGIPPDLLPRLFEPFLTTKETGKGVGLGLAISKTIVERHGGQIEVESQPGRGTTFYVFLPVDARAKSLETAATAVSN